MVVGAISFAPICWCAAFSCLEYAVEMCARRETTLRRDNVVAIIRKFYHHLFGGTEAYVA